MKKLSMVLLSAFLIAGFTVLAQAEKPAPLADIYSGDCTSLLTSPDATSLYVSWSWETRDDKNQTKFGGDAVYECDATVMLDGIVVGEYVDEEVEIEIARHPGDDELEEFPDDYAGKLLYWCEPTEDAPAGVCDGILENQEESAFNALMDKYGLDVNAEVSVGDCELKMVNVKAMNPGGNGRQNYGLTEVDICVAE